MKKWTIEDSKELYNINGWGTSYFGINEKGDVYVTPCKNDTQIDLREVMDELALRDVTPPVLLRFPDILDNRIEKTWSCLRKPLKSTTTKERTMWSIQLRSIRFSPLLRKSSHMERNSTLA